VRCNRFFRIATHCICSGQRPAFFAVSRIRPRIRCDTRQEGISELMQLISSDLQENFKILFEDISTFF
jgi:hypothetical protein